MMVTVQIIKGDAIEVMRTLPTESVDLCLTDPPYCETSLGWDKRVVGWPDEVARILKPSGSLWCFGSLRSFLRTCMDFAHWLLIQDLVWEKHNGSNSAADRFRRVHELVSQWIPQGRRWGDVYKKPQTTPDAIKRQVRRKRRPPHWGGIGESVYVSKDGGPRLMRSVIYCRSAHGMADHPTQKPEAILEPLVRYSCPPGGIVLDPFCGSGSTGRAAETCGCSAILIDKHLESFHAAEERIRNDAPLLSAVQT